MEAYITDFAVIEFDTVDKHAHESCARFDSAAGPTQTKKCQRVLAKEKEKSVAKPAGRSQPSVVPLHR